MTPKKTNLKNNITNDPTITDKERKQKPRTFKDNIRQLRFNLSALRADIKVVMRAIYRELKYFIPIQDLLILFFWIAVIILLLIMILVLGVPFAYSIIIQDLTKGEELQKLITSYLFSEITLKYAAGVIGIVTIIIRAMVKSQISKYRDKVNARKDVTYIFGASKFAEKFLYEMIYQYGYEERVSLIADHDYLWIRKLKPLIDIYVVEDLIEFEKPNLYEIVGFQNASRIMILTESVELNQNILTNIRQVRPNVEIILLSQYAPSFVFSNLVKDENLVIIDDLETTIRGLVLSLSLDIHTPQVVEIDVPKTFIGYTGEQMSSDIPGVDVVLIKRNDQLLMPEEKLQYGDRVITFFTSNYFMKMTNRIVTELPAKPPKRKKKKKKEERIIERQNVE